MRKARIPGANVSVRRRCDRCITTSYASKTHIVRDKVAEISSSSQQVGRLRTQIWLRLLLKSRVIHRHAQFIEDREELRPIDAANALQALALVKAQVVKTLSVAWQEADRDHATI